jgi:hypothetical protein
MKNILKLESVGLFILFTGAYVSIPKLQTF